MSASIFARAAQIAAKPDVQRVDDRRRFLRVPLGVRTQIVDRAGGELAGRTMDLSAGGALIQAPPALQPGGVVVYLGELGRAPAEIVRVRDTESDIAVRFQLSLSKRERLVEGLIWLINARPLGLDQERRAPRIAPRAAPATTAECEDGAIILVQVVDCSLVGARLATAQAKPALGSWVKIGPNWARVARHTDEGFAVDFAPRPAAAQIRTAR